METAVVSTGDKSSYCKCCYILSPTVLIEGYAKFQWEIREDKHVFIFSSTLMGHPEICLWTLRVNTLIPVLCGTSKSRGGPCCVLLVMEAFREFVVKVSFPANVSRSSRQSGVIHVSDLTGIAGVTRCPCPLSHMTWGTSDACHFRKAQEKPL